MKAACLFFFGSSLFATSAAVNVKSILSEEKKVGFGGFPGLGGMNEVAKRSEYSLLRPSLWANVQWWETLLA